MRVAAAGVIACCRFIEGRFIMDYRVYNQDGKDVTDEKQWFVSPDGKLFFLTEDIDSPMKEAGDGYWFGDRGCR